MHHTVSGNAVGRKPETVDGGIQQPLQLFMFVPSAKRFYDLNQDVVRQFFPEVETTVVNAFVVPGGKKPYGTHSASGIALQIPSLVKKGLGFPKHYMSFHTALTPTPLTRCWRSSENVVF
jgi:hypothetical protein